MNSINREHHQLRSVVATRVTPAIMATDTKDFVAKISQAASLVDWVQIDAVDGLYAPHKTWPYIGDEDGFFSKIVRQDEPMPFWEEMNFEVDLIVKDPMFEADRWIAAGAMRLVVHIDSIEINKFVELSRTIYEKGVELVLGFGIDSSYEKLAKYIEVNEKEIGGLHHAGHIVKTIQCMGIKRIGFQSEPFDTTVLSHIKKIKENYPYMIVSVDGGVHEDTAPLLISAGADRLVIGSSLFNSSSMKDSIVDFSNMFNK